MKRTWFCILAIAMFTTASFGQRPASTLKLPEDGQIIPLWPDGAPGQQGKADDDIPTITVYLPRTPAPNQTAVIVCPGGGYVHLAMNHEGRQVANYLNSLGIAAYVLKYRLGPKYHHPIELGDAQRAIRLVRSKSAEWGIATDRVGIMGFSAGGHLAASASTQFNMSKGDPADPIDLLSNRPDFAILGYPVISLTAPWTHRGSRDALLGKDADPELAKSLSGENAVSAQTPPTFIFQTNADTTVPAENSIMYFLALRKAGVKAEMHVFETGSHGLGLAANDPALSEWSRLLTNWLRVHSLIR